MKVVDCKAGPLIVLQPQSEHVTSCGSCLASYFVARIIITCTLQARRARDVEAAFERQREKDRRAAEEKAVEAERAYRDSVRKWEKEERCVAESHALPRCLRIPGWLWLAGNSSTIPCCDSSSKVPAGCLPPERKHTAVIRSVHCPPQTPAGCMSVCACSLSYSFVTGEHGCLLVPPDLLYF